MIKGLREKFRKNEKGFTLIEMLIVVAIIAILIAVAIPLVNSALEKARDATDQANERAAKAEALLFYTGVASSADMTAAGYTAGSAANLYFDAEDGKMVGATAAQSLEPYGKCTGGTDCYGDTPTNHTTMIIKVEIAAGGGTTVSWIAPASAT